MTGMWNIIFEVDLNLFTTGLILLGDDTHLKSINDSALKILGWDFETLQENWNSLGSLDPNLKNLETFIKKPEKKKSEIKISQQNYQISINPNSEFCLIEIYPIVYQDLKQTTHELKRPIQNIKTLVETLIMGAKDEKSKCDEYLGKLNQEADRLGAMVQDLLSLNNIQNMQMNKTRIQAHGLIQKILENSETRAKGIKLINEVPEDLEIFADIKLFEHLFANLIDNAIKYNRENGTVIIGYENGIFVQDSGLGIKEEDINKIFEQFYRTQSTSHIQGTGLGLSIVKAIADLHGWTIQVQSEIGVGTRIELMS